MTQRVLDLTHYHFKRELHGLTLIGTWIKLEDRHRPCLVIVRAGEETNDHTFPCVVTVDKAWIWDETIGDSVQAVCMAFRFAEALRLKPEMNTLIGLSNLINDHLGDLLNIPPFLAREQGDVIGHVTTTELQTGKTTETEVYEPDV